MYKIDDYALLRRTCRTHGQENFSIDGILDIFLRLEAQDSTSGGNKVLSWRNMIENFQFNFI